MKRHLLFCWLVFITSYFLGQSKSAVNYPPDREYNGQSIFEVASVPEEKIDIGLWSLIIAKEFDKSVNVNHYLKILDGMADEINRMLAGRNSDMDKFLAVKTFLFTPGLWNQHNPFSYDLDDPLGDVLEHQLLSSYIDSRRGNCLSMPVLFLALMERVDPNVPFVGVRVPVHFLCRFKDRQTKDVWNVETTNGGNPARNQWYIERFKISQTALNKNTYLRDLTKKETIAELLSPLIRSERKKGNFEKALTYTDLGLRLSPNSDLNLVSKGALFAEVEYRKSKNGSLTEIQKKYYESESEKYINQAKELGWRQQTPEEIKEYLDSVKKEKSKNKGR